MSVALKIQNYIDKCLFECSYDMTPMRVYKTTSPSPDNYGIEDLKSDDDTDDEDQPRKRIPAWAQGKTMIHFTRDQSSVCYTAYFIKLN